jgi:hypothetical protein
MYDLTITAPLSVFVSLAALTGVTLHDTKADKLATSIIAMPSNVPSTEGSAKSVSLDSSAHTHVERVSLNDVKSSQPRIAPRIEHKKHMMQKNMPKGANRYDGYALPLA